MDFHCCTKIVCTLISVCGIVNYDQINKSVPDEEGINIMGERHLFLTSSGLSKPMQEKFFEIIGKSSEEAKILYIPTAGLKTDGGREGFAVCLHELSLMGIPYENILVYHLELLLSKEYKRTYSAYVKEPHMTARLLTVEELRKFDAVFVSGGDSNVLCHEMVRTGFDHVLAYYQ